MKTRNYFFYIASSIVLITLFNSCSDLETKLVVPDNSSIKSKRVVVVEEFTGSSCPNCPKGLAASAALKETYPYNVIVIAVHSKFQSDPITKGQVKLNNADDDAIETFVGVLYGKPEATINRLYDNVNQSYRYGVPDTWRSYVDNELQKDPQVEIQMDRSFDSISRNLNVTITVKALVAINEPIHLHCGITESNIIEDQDDNNTIIVNFVHNHVLRKMLTTIPGEKIADNIAAGQTIQKSYSFILPVDAILWKAENCDIFSYVSLDPNKKYILQGSEIRVK